MVNKKFWPVILVIVLVFGMSVIGCNNGATNGGGDGYTNILNTIQLFPPSVAHQGPNAQLITDLRAAGGSGFIGWTRHGNHTEQDEIEGRGEIGLMVWTERTRAQFDAIFDFIDNMIPLGTASSVNGAVGVFQEGHDNMSLVFFPGRITGPWNGLGLTIPAGHYMPARTVIWYWD